MEKTNFSTLKQLNINNGNMFYVKTYFHVSNWFLNQPSSSSKMVFRSHTNGLWVQGFLFFFQAVNNLSEYKWVFVMCTFLIRLPSTIILAEAIAGVSLRMTSHGRLTESLTLTRQRKNLCLNCTSFPPITLLI